MLTFASKTTCAHIDDGTVEKSLIVSVLHILKDIHKTSTIQKDASMIQSNCNGKRLISFENHSFLLSSSFQ